MNNLKAALMKRIIINNLSGCWEIQGYLDKDGYGEVSGKRAHRVAYESFIGEIPAGVNVCHKCDNRRCCNPEHFFLGTQKDNITDMMLKGRKDPRYGERNTQNKLTEQEVFEVYHSIGIQRIVALKYEIDQSTVSNIKSGKLWGWLTDKRYAVKGVMKNAGS